MIARKPINIKLGRIDLVSSFFLVMYCLPTRVLNDWFVDVLYGVWIIGFIWALLLYFCYKLYRYRYLYPIVFWTIVIFCSSIMNGTRLISVAKVCIIVFSSSMLTFTLFLKKKVKILYFLSNLFFALMCIQGYSMITNCFGLSNETGDNKYMYFFGIRVDFNEFYIFAISILFITTIYGGLFFKIIFIIAQTIALYYIIMTKLSTAIISTIVFWGIFLMSRIVINTKQWGKLYTLSFVLIIIFGLTYTSSNIFSWLLIDFLHEGLTLNGRTLLWKQALDYMKGWHWVVGNGYGHSYIFKLGLTFAVGSAHSQYINCLFDFGIIGLFSYFLLFWPIIESLRSLGREDTYTKRIMVASLFAVLITGIPTTFFWAPYMYIYIIIFSFVGLTSKELMPMIMFRQT